MQSTAVPVQFSRVGPHIHRCNSSKREGGGKKLNIDRKQTLQNSPRPQNFCLEILKQQEKCKGNISMSKIENICAYNYNYIIELTEKIFSYCLTLKFKTNFTRILTSRKLDIP